MVEHPTDSNAPQLPLRRFITGLSGNVLIVIFWFTHPYFTTKDSSWLLPKAVFYYLKALPDGDNRFHLNFFALLLRWMESMRHFVYRFHNGVTDRRPLNLFKQRHNCNGNIGERINGEGEDV